LCFSVGARVRGKGLGQKVDDDGPSFSPSFFERSSKWGRGLGLFVRVRVESVVVVVVVVALASDG
jgi:hypothetical protein